jgi:hypothetical protein
MAKRNSKGIKALRIIDTGKLFFGFPIVNIYLIDGFDAAGQNYLLYNTDVRLAAAESLAEWFRSLGVPIEWVTVQGIVVESLREAEEKSLSFPEFLKSLRRYIRDKA